MQKLTIKDNRDICLLLLMFFQYLKTVQVTYCRTPSASSLLTAAQCRSKETLKASAHTETDECIIKTTSGAAF